MFFITMEDQVEIDKRESEFKDALLIADPKRYFALFSTGVDYEELESDEFEWIVPKTEEEARQLLANLGV